jgi:hypothetical protein
LVSPLTRIIKLSLFDELTVSTQKEGGSGVLWTGSARPQHPAPRFIEKIQLTKQKAQQPGGGSANLSYRDYYTVIRGAKSSGF